MGQCFRPVVLSIDVPNILHQQDALSLDPVDGAPHLGNGHLDHPLSSAQDRHFWVQNWEL